MYQNVSKEEVKDFHYWKFYCGLSDKHNGLYSLEDQDAYFSASNGRELLLERIREDKMKFPVLFLKKEVILWTQTNYDIRLTHPFSSSFYSFLLLFNQGYLNLVLILFVIGLFPRKGREMPREVLFIKILLGLYYGVYLWIEISPRYAYNLHMLCFFLVGIGLERIMERKDWLKVWKREK